MKPFYRLDNKEQNCELHIEEHCFARVCNGFIQLGVNYSLDFSSIPEQEGEEKVLIKDESEVITLGMYKNHSFKLLRIPFFKKDD